MDVIEGSRFRKTLRLWLYLAAGDMPRVAVGGDMAELVDGWGGGCVDWRGGTIWSLMKRVYVVVCYGEENGLQCAEKSRTFYLHVHCDYVIYDFMPKTRQIYICTREYQNLTFCSLSCGFETPKDTDARVRSIVYNLNYLFRLVG